jgi:site-specific recombinase XerD
VTLKQDYKPGYPVIITPEPNDMTEQSCPALTDHPSGLEVHNNPAIAYLTSLGSKKSRQTMSSFLTIVVRMLGGHDIHSFQWSQVRRLHVQAVMELLNDSGKAPATINTYLSAIKGVALEAWTMKQIDTDNFYHIKHVRPSKGTRVSKGRALSRSEIEKLFFTCQSDTTSKGLRDATIISVLIGCGLRRAEVVALDMASVNTREQSLKVLGKGNKERWSYMPEGTAGRVNTWVQEVRGDFPGPLFPRIRRHDDVTDQRMTGQAIYHILETRRLESGLENFSPHDLRRTFASVMLENGEDIVTVKDAMGHADIKTTQQYDRRGSERLKLASQRITST